MKETFLKKELEILRSNLFKALNIYEEENDIKPLNDREHLDRKIKNPLPFKKYVDKLNKNIEGLIVWLSDSEESLETIKILSKVKIDLHSIERNVGVNAHLRVRNIIFKHLNIISKVIETLKIDKNEING